AAVLESFDAAKLASVLEALPLDVASRLTRRLPAECAEAALEKLGPRSSRALRALLHFRENTAGSLMDPNVLALPSDLTAREALQQIRKTPESARYNVYVVDSEQRLAGAVNLRELLLAKPQSRLADLMVRDPLRLDAHADRSVIVTHPGWKEVHSLPVVDEGGGYLGAVRYRTLRALEEEMQRGRTEDGDVRESLGQLFSAGAGGLLDALTSFGPPRSGGG
ncbi:MAG: CBS domain-containing protein, partial [Deltaproteobacteria bacterium]|nr:CBS domain-containing protein [Deltaproteobacteria bacterium]